MFEEYLEDSYYFYESIGKMTVKREKERYLRASIFYVASAIESFMNHIGETFNKGESISEHEIAFLLDKKIIFDSDKIEVKDKIEYHKIEDKIKLIVRKFSCNFDFNSSEWSDFMAFKRFRDLLIHPREMDNEISIEEYKNQTEKGLKSSIAIMNSISLGIFKRPLRKKLLDLIPE
jgi:hypothetical protein